MQHAVSNWHVDRSCTTEWEALRDELHALMRAAAGFRSVLLLRSVEHPGNYVTCALWAGRQE